MAFSREVAEGLQVQGPNETITWAVDVENWSDSPTSPDVTVYDLNAASEDVTDDVTEGSASVDGTTITLPQISGLTNGHLYRIDVSFTSGADTEELFMLLRCGD